MVIGKAWAVLGFVKRWSREFIGPYISKLLYILLLRPILKYSSIVWNSYYRCHSDLVEAVQKRFYYFVYVAYDGIVPMGFRFMRLD